VVAHSPFFSFYTRHEAMKTIASICLFIFLSPAVILSQNAPVTIAGRVTTATPGNQSVPVPVTVTGFTNIGQFTLTMKFDTTRVRFVSATASSSLPGMTVVYTHPSGNTQGKLTFSWSGAANVSLADGTSIVNLTFHYVTGSGILSWSYTFGSVCQYKRYNGAILVPLNDTPKYQTYLNGGISNRTAPVTFAPVIASPVPGSLSIPITVNGFTTIGGFTLNLEYDSTVVTYLNTFTKNPAFGSAFQVGTTIGTGGKKIIVIQWYGSSLSLASGSALVTLNFSYPTANCNPGTLNWIDIGPSCEFSDSTGDILIDMPQSSYYSNGIVASGLYPTWTGNASNSWSDPANWNACGVPDLTRLAIIPVVAPNPYPVLTTSAYCKSLKILNGATFTVGQTGSITVGTE
jgi:hypothetical protein